MEARDRHGETLNLIRGDLRAPLPISAETMDLVLVQLDLEHVRDWDAIAGVGHARARARRYGGDFRRPPFYDLFRHRPGATEIGAAEATAAAHVAVQSYAKRWGNTEDGASMPMYRRSLSEVTRPFLEAAQPIEEGTLTYFAERTPRFLGGRATLVED